MENRVSVNSIPNDSNLQVLCREFGDPLRVLRAEPVELTPIGADQVRVQLHLAPVNPSDLIPVWGRYSHRVALPFISGYEGVGTVVETGSAVSRALLGKRVLPLQGEGTWQQFILSPAEFAVPIPDWMSDIAAAQLYINPLTAWVICRYQFTIQAGETLIINAAGSAIGRLFAQLSRILGFKLIAVVRNIKHRQTLLELGATAVIEDDREMVAKVKRLTDGKGADYAVDLVGAESGTRLAFALKTHGRFMALGLFSGRQANWAEISQNLTVQAEMFHLRLWNNNVGSEQWRKEFARLIELVGSKQLILSQQGDIFDLADFQAAIEASTQSGRINKVFLSGQR